MYLPSNAYMFWCLHRATIWLTFVFYARYSESRRAYSILFLILLINKADISKHSGPCLMHIEYLVRVSSFIEGFREDRF